MYDRKHDYLRRRRDQRSRRSRDSMYAQDEARRRMRDSAYQQGYAQGYDHASRRDHAYRQDGTYNVGHYIYDVPEHVPHMPVEYKGYDSHAGGETQEYKRDLVEWERKLKSKDMYNLPKHEVIKKAKEMGVRFDQYEEDEFYTMYLLHMNLYTNHGKDPHAFIAMTRAFLESDCFDTHPEERVCKFLYHLGLDE